MIRLIPKEEIVVISHFKDIVKSFKYEMKPTRKQEVLLNQTLSICRHLYNDLLGERKEGWENGGWNVNYYDQKSHLVILKNRKDNTGQSLKNIQSQILQNVVQRVDRSYKFVGPKYTSQNCGRCNKLVGRFDEIFECHYCGLTINVNASINIRDRNIEYQNRLKSIITPATGEPQLKLSGRACLNSPKEKDVMIQETASDKGGTEDIENTISQAPPFRAR